MKKIRIEFDIEEHDYQALNELESPIGDSYAYNGDNGVENLQISVDGELLDEDFVDENKNDEFTSYREEVLSWDDEEDDVAFFGYYLNKQHHVYEFETEDFDLNKLVFKWDCYDVIFEAADYSVEEHCLSVLYDGVVLENLVMPGAEGDFEQQWSIYGD